jgi:hypothetical protein
LFWGGDTTVVWRSNYGSCFVVGIRRKFVIKLWQLFCGEDKTVVLLSNDGSCFVVGIRQWIGYRMMEVALWWGYDSNLAIE